jgi:hypothetical protein
MQKGKDMHLARLLRPLAVAGLSAITMLAPAAANATPQATAGSALYTAPFVQGVSPASSQQSYFFLDGGNWAGYEINSSSTTFINVQANFSVPSVNCTKTATGYASQAAGLGGGINNSSGLESDGVTAACVSGAASYKAWWETYPDPQTDTFSVHPGDAITADVAYDGTAGTHEGQYHFTLTDQTTGKSFSKWKSCAATTCLNTSAEVVSVAPSDSSNGAGSSILPLADYGAANFVGASVTEQNGQTAGFLISSSAIANQITQVSATTNDILATPSTLYGGEAFSNTWDAAS